MKLTPRTASSHSLGTARHLRTRTIVAPALAPAVVLLLAGPGTHSSGPVSNGPAASAVPWYVPSAITLLAAAITASATWLTARWNRSQQRRDRRRDRIDRRQWEAERRAEAELRERRVASQTSWTSYFQRVEDMLLAVGTLQYEARQRRLHDDDVAVTELARLGQVAELYADHAPGQLSAALEELAEAISGIGHYILPQAAELDRISQHSSPSAVCLPLFVRAGEQARAADRLAQALKGAYGALHRERGMN